MIERVNGFISSWAIVVAALQQWIGEVVGSGHCFPVVGDAGLGVEMGVFWE